MAEIADKAHDFAGVLRQMGSPRIELTEPSSNQISVGSCIRVSRRDPTTPRCPRILIIVDGPWLQTAGQNADAPAPELNTARLDALNIDEIESVRVLGPVEARFCFGTRGRFGAILVETRKGASGGGEQEAS